MSAVGSLWHSPSPAANLKMLLVNCLHRRVVSAPLDASTVRSMSSTSFVVMPATSSLASGGTTSRASRDRDCSRYWGRSLSAFMSNHAQASVWNWRSGGTSEGSSAPGLRVIGSIPSARAAFASARRARAAASVTTG